MSLMTLKTILNLFLAQLYKHISDIWLNPP